MFSFSRRKTDNQSNNNPYSYMRSIAFAMKPEMFEAEFSSDAQVFGAVVDMEVGNGCIATMVCFIDGSASLYFSTGGGIIGAGQHDNVRNAVFSYLSGLSKVLPIMEPTENINVVPKENHHIFYIFTRNGIYSYDLDINNYQKSQETSYLFSLSQIVLREIRITSQKK